MAMGKHNTPEDQIRATIYGQCVGDAIGLLTEFLDKRQAIIYYDKVCKQLEYEHKTLCEDLHRSGWSVGDWTDDSDQMILILLSLLENDGKVVATDFAGKLDDWRNKGFPEFGDFGGMGIGATTVHVLRCWNFKTDPHMAARQVWERSNRYVAPNGALMRTSVLGIHQFWDTEAVIENALEICKTTHYDPRCQASCVAMVTAISLMLKRDKQYIKPKGTYKVKEIIKDSYEYAARYLDTKEKKKELLKYMTCEKLSDLKLCETNKIGYTYKCLGAGFWALKQKDFREALQALVMEAGDADTNCCVAGALLGCKLGLDSLPKTWISELKHLTWLDDKIDKFLNLENEIREKMK